MSRRIERTILGVLAFAGAVLALVVGVRLLTSGDAVDVAAGSVGGVEATAPASPSGEADSGVGPAPDSMVVSTTAGPAPTSSSTTLNEAVTSTTAEAGATSTSISASDDGVDATSAPAETSASEAVVESATTPTPDGPPSSETDVSSSSTVVGPDLTDIELEIIRLTNELRVNPAGPQRRQKPMPECVNDDNELEIDPETGHPEPVHRLTSSRPISIRMSRDWSQQMADADAMSHRSAESQSAIYAELGIDWAARGENVAWAVGYDLADVAELFFRGWRESDGHYCNMMSGAFTVIGVGHVRTDGGKDFATQNFYRPR